MGLFGAEALAAHQIALQIAAMSFMVPLGLAQAATVRVGLAYGAGDAAGISRAGWTAYMLGVGFMALMALVLVLFPRTLAGAFLDPTDPASARVIETAVTFLAFVALFQIADGAQAVGAGMLRGLNDTRVPMLYAAFGYAWNRARIRHCLARERNLDWPVSRPRRGRRTNARPLAPPDGQERRPACCSLVF
jgi:MATE family multidrug resistance protein